MQLVETGLGYSEAQTIGYKKNSQTIGLRVFLFSQNEPFPRLKQDDTQPVGSQCRAQTSNRVREDSLGRQLAVA